MEFVELAFLLLALFMAVFMITQVVLPIVQGTQLFPSFRKQRKQILSELEHAKFEEDNFYLKQQLNATRSKYQREQEKQEEATDGINRS